MMSVGKLLMTTLLKALKNVCGRLTALLWRAIGVLTQQVLDHKPIQC